MDLIYALGGGMGHLTRALNLAAILGPVRILHQAPYEPPSPMSGVLTRLPEGASAAWVRQWLSAHPAERLIVDTFPGGVAHEIDDATLGGFSQTVLVQRHLKRGTYVDYARLADRFDVRWLPYPPDACAWEGDVEGIFVGPLVRRLERAPGPRASVAVIGDPNRLPLRWRAMMPTDTVYWEGHFTRLPAAERFVCVGAGHNLSWELWTAKVAAAHLPLPRRYDDQHRRAERIVFQTQGRPPDPVGRAGRVPFASP
ncbi:MAG: hypothetical protein AAFV53_06855, partial [Myxococcota bacterium]